MINLTAGMGIQECPRCHQSLPVMPGFTTWCDHCNWNVQPKEKSRNTNFLYKVYQKLGEKQGQALFDYFKRQENISPKFSFPLLLAYVLAGLVHSLTLLALIGAIIILIQGFPYLIAILTSVALLGMVWLLRPRFIPSPKTVLSREKYPALYEMVGRVAGQLGSQIDAIVLEADFNAHFACTGIHQKRTLYIGLALWWTLNDQEKMALLGHELGHDVNGDYTRGLFISSAVESLVAWHKILNPPRYASQHNKSMFIIQLPVDLTFAFLSWLIRGTAYLILYLLYRDHQGSEYLADLKSAQVAGTDAALCLLEKLYQSETLHLAVQNCATNPEEHPDLFKLFSSRMMELPERELERRRRAERLSYSRLDITHPPTPFRTDMLCAHPRMSGTLALPVDLYDRVEAELAPLRMEVQKILIDQYRQSVG